MYFLHAIISDRQTRLLNVFGQIAMFWETKNSNSDKMASNRPRIFHHIKCVEPFWVTDSVVKEISTFQRGKVTLALVVWEKEKCPI